ncbi:MAG TPA: heavy-metal-associated domain-containing protein [Candidatus Angelobacter sp.]|nr:heavy-metal-associated domain-containing protein [Candidatus Angelobacter sp.]
MSTTTWTVQGMTCSHCVHAVTTEISAIPGVSDVVVDLPSGLVTVTADTDPSAESVAAAVDEAGYTLVTS